MGDYNIAATFNVSDSSRCLDDAYQADLRKNLLQQGVDDGGLSKQFLISLSYKHYKLKSQKMSISC